jgi:hypothetical protein
MATRTGVPLSRHRDENDQPMAVVVWLVKARSQTAPARRGRHLQINGPGRRHGPGPVGAALGVVERGRSPGEPRRRLGRRPLPPLHPGPLPGIA